MHKDYKEDCWKEFNQLAYGKKVYIFGAVGAKHIIRDQIKYGYPWNIAGILDNDQKKWGTEYIKGWIVSSPHVLLEENLDELVVLISGLHTSEMGKQLHEIGVKNYFSEFWMTTDMKDFIQQDIDDNKILSLFDILSDEQSKEIVKNIVFKRKNGIMDYSDICSFEKSEYFLDEFWKPGEQEVFVDAGGYTGDTIEEFLDWTKGHFKRIYSFEPQTDKALHIKKNLWRYVGNENIRFSQVGVWSKETLVDFIDGDDRVSGRIGENSGNKISTIALDEAIQEAVTFIKMDIEGAEIEAIKGAEGHIKNDKPKLAISIYHKPNDLWEIPLLIHKLAPEYKLYIRHNGVRYYGTNVYAYI